jgi:hypothetical protein
MEMRVGEWEILKNEKKRLRQEGRGKIKTRTLKTEGCGTQPRS